MRVLLLGSGGREHALAWKIAQSPTLTELLCAPGNPGTAALAENIPTASDDARAVVSLARQRRVDLVVIGPEMPLVKGVVDALAAEGISAFGPVAGGAKLEGSKSFAKELMEAARVPTARFRVFDSPAEAELFVRKNERVVIKADGLAAGKGVVVACNAEEAVAAVRSLSALGESGKRLVIEELLEGREVSVIALCDGERFALLPPAQDHKRVGENDTGPNTGGMGAYAPVPFVDAETLEKVGETIIAPVLAEIARRGFPFRGALYAGLMVTDAGLQVLEFNCRFGDPEAQALMLQLDEDLLPLLAACAQGSLRARSVRTRAEASIAVVLASEGYPGSPKVGDPITGLDALPERIIVFHAGTKVDDQGQLVTAGGRVLSVCAQGQSLSQARASAYQAIAGVHFRGMHYRQDIGARVSALPSTRAKPMENSPW
jgi:phosphoribosylamine--glycine ligase